MSVIAHSPITVTVDRHGKPIGLGRVESSDYYATKAGAVSVEYVRADQLTGAVEALRELHEASGAFVRMDGGVKSERVRRAREAAAPYIAGQ